MIPSIEKQHAFELNISNRREEVEVEAGDAKDNRDFLKMVSAGEFAASKVRRKIKEI